MSVSPENMEKIEPLESMGHSSSRRVFDAAFEASSDAPASTADPADGPIPDHSTSSPSPPGLLEIQPPPSLRSEEYRQLFHLPPEEVLIQDFNCALQDNFLVQGHMYLFAHYICFYSNLFGFETKKMISFHEVTSVRRAKVAGIFPTAIDIIAGAKKYFFTSFLSRDEAFKLINDGWLQFGNGAEAITDQQESRSELDSQENGIVAMEKQESSKQAVDELDSSERNKDVSVSEDSSPPHDDEAEIASASPVLQDNVEVDAEVVLITDCSYSGNTSVWEQEDSDVLEVPEYYTMVAESKFPIKVKQFFDLFFSDDTVGFLESFHKKCGDKEIRCSSWYSHDKFGRVRDVSFQHPIKLSFGAKFGSCQEVQKYRVYRNSHLLIETSQEINDVPYGDYFRVEGRWDVEKDGDCCILRVYINVAFSKKTMFRGKIVHSTVEECRDVYAIWINIAHELLKQKSLEKEAGDHAATLIRNGQVHRERQEVTEEHSERPSKSSDLMLSLKLPDSNGMNQQVDDTLQESSSIPASVVSLFKDSMVKLCLSLKSQSQLPLLIIITVAVIILLMQISIVVLLGRPQQIHVISQADWMSGMRGVERSNIGTEMMALLEKRINHLKDNMLMVETLLEKTRQEYALLKLQLKDLELLRKQQS